MNTSDKPIILLPQPRTFRLQTGLLILQNSARIVCQGDAQTILPIAARLQTAVRETQNLQWQIGAGSAENTPLAQAVLTLDSAGNLPAQGYHLRITPKSLQIRARDAAGLFYGVMTGAYTGIGSCTPKRMVLTTNTSAGVEPVDLR